MRYSINFAKTICQLVPHYLGGRKFLLFLHACMRPLQTLNAQFQLYCREKTIEYTMTSQVFKLEWFLNRQFSQHFENQAHKIEIGDRDNYGIPIFNEGEYYLQGESHMILRNKSEDGDCVEVYNQHELTSGLNASFKVYVPKLKGNDPTFEPKLRRWLDKYKLTNKTYLIVYAK